jgi:uncharacterized delta-60 repeat protein
VIVGIPRTRITNMKRKQPIHTPRFEPLEGRQMFAAGDLDLTFGNGGKLASGALPFAPQAIAVQADGKIVAVGELHDDFAVARINPDGKLDRTFGGINRGDGIVTTDFGGNDGDRANGVAIQPDGRIVVVGVRFNAPLTAFGARDQFALARFNRDGSPDKTFSSDGKQTVSFGGHVIPEGAEATAVSINPANGKIAVVGMKNNRSNQDHDYVIVQLTRDGQRDNSFSGDGELNVRFSFEDRNEIVRAVIAMPDGKLLVGAQNSDQMGIWRFKANGDNDTTFGSGGKTFISMSKPRLNGLAIVPQTNQVVAVGDSNGLPTVIKLTSAGKRDNSFGFNGIAQQRFAQNGTLFHALPMGPGRILVSGTAGGDSNMMMFKSDGKFETSFGRNGIVVQNLGGSDGIRQTSLDSTGRIVAHGTNGQGQILKARFQNVPPVVEVRELLNNQVTEGSSQPAAILVRRDAAYPFPTRVFLDITSPATEGLDYTSAALKKLRTFSTPPGGGSGQLVPVQTGIRYFVDIPAGQDFVVAEIFAKADNLSEGNEAVRWSAVTDPGYQLGITNVAHVTIHDPTSAAPSGTGITRALHRPATSGLFSEDSIAELY